MSFVTETGQLERLQRAAAIQAAGGSAFLGAFVSGSGVLIPVGLLAAVGTSIHAWQAVRCPKCRYNLSWHGVNRVDVSVRNAWLWTVEECPSCRYRPAGAEPAAEPVPQEKAGTTLLQSPPAPAAAPWRVELPTVEKPAGSDYGYVERGELVDCTRDEWIGRFRRLPFPRIAWSPATPQPTRFEHVPELLALERERRVAAARGAYWGPLAFVVAALAGVLLGGGGLKPGSGTVFFIGIGILVLGLRLHARRGARRLEAATVTREMEDSAHDAWLRGQKARLTQVLAGAIVAVAAAQAISPGESARVAGMLPAAVRAGEWWRLLSYGVMHAHPIHLWFNLLALLSLGKLMEVHAARALLPLVFLVTVITGGLVGLALGPDIPMVGASGGLLGLIGFLTVVGFRRRERVPHGFAATMLKDVAFVAAVGLVGFRFIANAGHLGGLLGGLALGALLVPRPGREERAGWRPHPAVAALGWASMAVVLATCAATAVYLFVAPR
ncbi:MAG: rhomboid family intramembrane serine protease [Longimicrobiaceae bacterium]